MGRGKKEKLMWCVVRARQTAGARRGATPRIGFGGGGGGKEGVAVAVAVLVGVVGGVWVVV